MKSVFFSYSRKDLDDAREISKFLVSSGIRIWQDIRSLGLGNTEEQIQKAIWENCAALLFYATKNSVESDFIRNVELVEAFKKSKSDPSFAMVPLLGIPPEELNNKLQESLLGDLSRYNGAIVREETGLSVAAQEVRRILLRNLLKYVDDQEILISLMTWQRTPGNITPQLDLDWSNIFSYDELFSQSAWDNYVRSALMDLKDAMLDAGQLKIRIISKAHLTAGFAFGFIFRPVTGFELIVQQGDQWWSMKASVSEDSKVKIVIDPCEIGSKDLAVNISISRDVDIKLGEFIEEHEVKFRAVLYCRPESGAGLNAVHDGDTAHAMGKEIGNAIRDTLSKYNISDIHIFAAVPLGLAYLIGSELNACGRIHLYEYDKVASKYYPSWTIEGAD